MYTIATLILVGLNCLIDLSRAATCDVMTKNVNEPKGDVQETCGTTIKYEDDTGIQDQGLCSSNGTSVLIQAPQHMNMSLYRRFSSNISTFCFRLELKYCDDYSYQCDDGTCINSFGRCDAFPDCINGSDEENCGRIACVEGQVPCDDNTQCIGSDERCDDIAHCHDHSDESAKYCDPKYIEPKHDPPSPLITVECEDSPYIIATTTSTTAPSTTTSTPMPTTTTTPPTTTTTSHTTTTTPPTTTTTSHTTTTTPATTTKIAIGISIAVIAIIVAAVAIGVYWYRRRHRPPDMTDVQQLSGSSQESPGVIDNGDDTPL